MDNLFFIYSVGIIGGFFDSAFGAGFGTLSSAIFLIGGFIPIKFIPLILITQFLFNVFITVIHHLTGNVNLKPKTLNLNEIFKRLRKLGYVESYKRGIPFHLKIVLILSLCGIAGSLIGVTAIIKLPSIAAKIYIGILIMLLGMKILVSGHKEYNFSWKRIIPFGVLASFNKAFTGGGFGPVLGSGLLLSGIQPQSVPGVTTGVKSFTCLLSILLYIFAANARVSLQSFLIMFLGALTSVPFSLFLIKKINEKKAKFLIAVIFIMLGIVTLAKVLL